MATVVHAATNPRRPGLGQTTELCFDLQNPYNNSDLLVANSLVWPEPNKLPVQKKFGSTDLAIDAGKIAVIVVYVEVVTA